MEGKMLIKARLALCFSIVQPVCRLNVNRRVNRDSIGFSPDVYFSIKLNNCRLAWWRDNAPNEKKYGVRKDVGADAPRNECWLTKRISRRKKRPGELARWLIRFADLPVSCRPSVPRAVPSCRFGQPA